ncbi:MAG: bifunctional riboflavin kinase/FAD synthetase [Acidobacteriia bacterium]|nr:bifunctional riboflavin kinase/FAD synthetase [Terriglobia bacterium]
MTTVRVFRSCPEWEREFPVAAGERTAVTVGNFDGVHLGHQRILQCLVERARGLAATPVAVTFDPHPARLLRPAEAPPLILTLEQRIARLAELGCAAVVVLPFTRELAQLAPEAFVHTILAGCLRARAVVVGANFRFGHQQAGDVHRLRVLGQELGLEVEVVPPVKLRGQTVSSTAIRAAVRAGRVSLAGRLLGRPFALTGTIQPGTGQGRRLVVPTLNLQPEQELLPASGVYATQTLLEGRAYWSATNVGVRPTFDGHRLTVESHLLDFTEELREGNLEVRFYSRLRDEQKFASAAELRAQVLRDIARARRFFLRLERGAALARKYAS